MEKYSWHFDEGLGVWREGPVLDILLIIIRAGISQDAARHPTRPSLLFNNQNQSAP
jgi:hypothetical protein